MFRTYKAAELQLLCDSIFFFHIYTFVDLFYTCVCCCITSPEIKVNKTMFSVQLYFYPLYPCKLSISGKTTALFMYFDFLH